MSQLEVLQRRADRERAARREAEHLLECKTREVHLANEQLRELAGNLRGNIDRTDAILDTAAEGIVTYWPSGEIELFNRSACEIFKIETGEAVNVRDLFDMDEHAESVLFPSSESAEVHDSDEHALRTELTGLRRESETFHAEATASRLDTGDDILYVALIRDLTRRKSLEARLFQSQKMESVGQLAAGIAHEINTPIQFVRDNMQFIGDAFNDLEELLNLYQRLTEATATQGAPQDLQQAISEQTEIVDLEFLREEFPKAIAQSADGIERVAKIVRAMKEFAQPGTNGKTSLNINTLIDNVLDISVNQWRDVLHVERQFEDSLPPVSCMAGPMNQAILNLVSNACEAIAENTSPDKGLLKICTRKVADCIELSFNDNGPGIPADVKPKLFNPFFTTKEVGAGMGQGLSFVYDLIVGKHHGNIVVNSSVGDGAEFILSIPVAQQ